MWLLLLSYIALIFADTECPNVQFHQDRRINTSFRLVQYNIEWGFIDQYGDCPGAGCTWHTLDEATKHLDAVSKNIQAINGDFVNICEIEGCDELNMLSNNTDYLPYLLKGTDSATGQNVGFLTKIDPLENLMRTAEKYAYPMTGSECNYYGESGTTGVSKHYYTFLNISNIPIAIIGCHLLAYPTDPQRCASREAQAQVLQNLIVSFDGYEVILIGDLNDFDATIVDANDNMPMSSVLDILKGNIGDHMGEYTLYSVANFLNKTERYTEWWDENVNCIYENWEVSMIDHILVSKYLYDKISNVFVYKYDEYCGTYNSDHYPVIVDFDF